MEPFKSGLTRAMPHIQAALPQTAKKYLTPERMTKIVLSALSRTPQLLNCTPGSVLKAVMESASLGLEPTGGTLGQAYLIPYRNKGTYEAQLIIGYRGLIALARRSGEIRSVEAHIIRHGDEYDLEYGLTPKLTHRPNLSGDAGEMVAVYCVAHFKDGGNHLEVMTRAEVEAIRKRSRAGNGGPWQSDYDEMARKTVVRRAAKYWPLSTELASAMDIEDRAESGEGMDTSDIIDGEILTEITQEPEPQKKSKTSRVRAKLTNGGSQARLAELQEELDAIATAHEEAAKAGDQDQIAHWETEGKRITQQIAEMEGTK